MSSRREFLGYVAVATAASSNVSSSESANKTVKSDSENKTPAEEGKISQTRIPISRMGYGCANLVPWDRDPITDDQVAKATRLVETAYENGITLFDHADIYAFGKAEAVFGEVLKKSPGLRNRIVIQSKCGQRLSNGWKPGEPIRPDLSRQRIMSSVEGSLRRLSTDRLDILLLHIADALAHPDEIAQCFEDLNRAGKVRFFGVSNHNAAQIELLKSSVRQPLIVNQIHLGLFYPYPMMSGMEFALQVGKGTLDDACAQVAGGGVLEYCRRHHIQIQAWSPLSGMRNSSLKKDSSPNAITSELEGIAKSRNTTTFAVALAWLMRHPAGIVPIIGPQNPEHIIENCTANRISLTRDEWYGLFTSAARLPVLNG